MICSKCNVDKPLSEFSLRSTVPLKYRSECKACAALLHKLYRAKNKEKLKLSHKAYYAKNKAQITKKEKLRYEKNKKGIKERVKAHYQDNKKAIALARRAYQKNKLQTDPMFKLKRNLRNRMWYALQNRNWKKQSNLTSYLGLTEYNELISFLENQFIEGMSWENYGKVWDIDHIIPLSSAACVDELIKLSHYTNLRPMFSTENRSVKRDTFDFNKELSVRNIGYEEGQQFLLKHHYLARKAPSEYTFGLFLSNGVLVGVCTFHTPYSPGLKAMICGPEYKHEVIELNRLAVKDELPKNTESWFVSKCLNSGIIKKHIIVSFADTAQGHTGTVYKALNFIYTGLTAKKKNFSVGDNRHPATLGKRTAAELRLDGNFRYEDRSQKHRYVLFIGDRRMKNKLMRAFKLSRA